MADADSRMETLEDEVKVLKGEVRRTLVDLRALLMREDSPLNEGSFGRRAALMEGDTGEAPVITQQEVSDMVRRETMEQARAVAQDNPPPAPPAAPTPVAPVPPIAGVGLVGQAFPQSYPSAPPPVMPLGQIPPWGAGAGYPPIPHPAPPATPPAIDPAIAERERKLAEQERRMENQERRMEDQERRISDASRHRPAADRGTTAEPEPEEASGAPVQPAARPNSQERRRWEEDGDEKPQRAVPATPGRNRAVEHNEAVKDLVETASPAPSLRASGGSGESDPWAGELREFLAELEE